MATGSTGLDQAVRYLATPESLARGREYYERGAVLRVVDRGDQMLVDVEEARQFVEAGDGRSALRILEAVTEKYVAGWTDLDNSDGVASAPPAGRGRCDTSPRRGGRPSRGKRLAPTPRAPSGITGYTDSTRSA